MKKTAHALGYISKHIDPTEKKKRKKKQDTKVGDLSGIVKCYISAKFGLLESLFVFSGGEMCFLMLGVCVGRGAGGA